MAKAISSICAMLLICFGGSAWAGKPKLAILGLEVAPGPTGVVEPAMTQVAKDITRELRQRAQSGTSPYVVAPNSSKELTDEKLLMSCDNEAKDCMAAIGAGLSADALLYGRVEKRGDVYRISLKLLDVKTKTIDPGGDEVAIGSSVVAVSRRLYSKLVGDVPSGAGSLVVTARSQSGAEVNGGRVMVDEDRKGVLSGGKLTVTGLAEGRHAIAIEVSGLQRFEATVTVRGGEPSTLDALLLDRIAGSTVASHARLWKVSLVASLVVAAAGGALAAYSYSRQNHFNDAEMFTGPENPGIGASDCGSSPGDLMALKGVRGIEFDIPSFQQACTWHTRNIIGFVVLGVGGAAAVASTIMLVRDPGAEEQQPPPTGTRNKKPDVAFLPIVTPELAGASLSIAW
jgi:hypothetical protein